MSSFRNIILTLINIENMQTPSQDSPKDVFNLISNKEANSNAPYIVVTMAGNSLMDILKSVKKR